MSKQKYPYPDSESWELNDSFNELITNASLDYDGAKLFRKLAWLILSNIEHTVPKSIDNQRETFFAFKLSSLKHVFDYEDTDVFVDEVFHVLTAILRTPIQLKNKNDNRLVSATSLFVTHTTNLLTDTLAIEFTTPLHKTYLAKLLSPENDIEV